MTNRYSPAIFISIPLSHYCEKARWALDRMAMPYTEEPHAPLLHRLATRRNGGGTVPVLVHGSERFVDSTDILLHADAMGGGDRLYPLDKPMRTDVDELEARFDRVLGPRTRQWAYAHLLPETKLLRELWSRGVPRMEAGLVTVIAPVARRLVRRGYRITPDSARRSLQGVHEIFQEVADRLRDGRPYLAGDRFTAADLTFAALAAPVLFPAGCRAVLPALDAAPPAMREDVLRLRDTTAGRFALRLYSNDRA